jgi:hypothetical protein
VSPITTNGGENGMNSDDDDGNGEEYEENEDVFF